MSDESDEAWFKAWSEASRKLAMELIKAKLKEIGVKHPSRPELRMTLALYQKKNEPN